VAKAGVEECEAALELLEQKRPQALALGECGLDFRTVHLGQEPESAKAKQRLFFERQLEMAKRARKVPILHVVRAHSEALNCLVDRTERGYLLHSFHAEIETSRRHLDRGAYLSVSGSLLRKGAHRLEDSIRNAPMERILLESDAPDQHPDPTLGAVNEPTTILLVAKRIAELKKSSEEKVLEQARDNFRELFRTEFIEGIAPK
jgi:TatD DNase family protein